MNANLDSQTGCLIVPTSGSISLGSCSWAGADQWTISSITASDASVTTNSSSSSLGVIIGCVVGGIIVLGGAIGGLIYMRKRSSSIKSPESTTNKEVANGLQTPEQYPKASDATANKSTTLVFARPSPPPSNVGLSTATIILPPATPTIGMSQSNSVLYKVYGGQNTGARSVQVDGFYKVALDFSPTRADEMELKAGEEIWVELAFGDGWALGTAVSSGRRGVFPAYVLVVPGQELAVGNLPTRSASIALASPQQPVYNFNTTRSIPSSGMMQVSSVPMAYTRTGNVQADDGAPGSIATLAAGTFSGDSQSSSTGTTTPPTSPISNSSSKLLIDASEIVVDRTQRLGEGGFGVVYVGMLRGSTPVAVKTIKGDLDEKTMRAFAKEVVTWEGLVQRNVLPLMAFCTNPPMMITDLVEEGNMRKYLGARSWDQALGRKVLADVAAGMAYLHASGILHGDLKSLNVLIDGQRAVITDFGLARLRVEVSKSTSKTGRGLQGTPGFVAPEILAGQKLAPPADVYAFAMTCYEVFSCGKYPFEDVNNVAAVVYKVAVERARPRRPDDVPDQMWELIERCWAHEPAERPTFVAIQKELARINSIL